MEPVSPQVVRSLVFASSQDPDRLASLMACFRLMVNQAIREAAARDLRSRSRMSTALYHRLAGQHHVQRAYIVEALGVAAGILKAHRRRARKGRAGSLPVVRRPFLRVPAQTVQLDRESGRLRIPVANGEPAVVLNLVVSDWHRAFLTDPTWRIAGLTVVPGRVILAFKKATHSPFVPESVVALDTNESSLDGVFLEKATALPVSLPLGNIRQIQQTHFRRRRRLAGKKAGDRRVMKRLLHREGRRERYRVGQRLHLVSKRLVEWAGARKAALALENLKGFRRPGKWRVLNRRLSSWPFRELHRQVEYKAALAGVPVIKVNPFNTSRSCPVCGDVQRRVRVGQVFECLRCGWSLDRQLNAGLNILKSALAASRDAAWARGLWFDPGALRKDTVNPLCVPGRAVRGESSGAGVASSG